MQQRAEHLSAALAKGVQPLYTVFGDEPLLAQEAADLVRAAARAAGYTERQVFTVSGAHFDWGEVLAAAGALSLFGDRQLIEIRMPTGKPGKEGADALQRYVRSLAEGVVTLVQLPRLDRTQQSSAWFTALESAGVTVRVDPVERRALPAWLAQRLAAQNQHVQEGDEGQRSLAFFADRVEGNLLAAHQELTKLALLYPAGALSFEQVESAVLNVARYDVFKLGEAVLAGHVARALRMLDGLRAEGEAPVLVHWTLAEDIRSLKRVKDSLAAGKPLPMALRENRVWGVKEKLFERVLPQLSDATVAALLDAAHRCDGLVKGLRDPEWPADPWEGLKRLALMLAQHTAAGPAARSRATPLRLALQP